MEQATARAVWWMVAHVPTLGLLTPLALVDVAARDVRRRTLLGAGASALAVLAGIVLVAAGAAVTGAAVLAAHFVGGLVALSARVQRAEQGAARPTR